MEPAATSLLVPRDPPPPPRKLGLTGWVIWATISLVTGGFAWQVYRARHSARDLALVGHDFYPTYGSFWMLCLSLMRRTDDDPVAAPERRRVRLAAVAVWLLLGASIALRFVDATPNLALKVALLVLYGLSTIGLAFYFLFAARRRRCPCGRRKLDGEGSPRAVPGAEDLTA